jgi:murein DD-endopeptidase MepM/ murein hydrolase activator NlpD
MLRGFILGVLLIGAGWIVGSLYPAPAAITAPIAQRVPTVAARLGLDEVSIESLRRVLSDEELARIRREASELAARTGEAIVVERNAESEESVAEQIASLQTAPAAAPASASETRAFERSLTLCPGMTVSNAPAADAQRRVRNYASLIIVNGTTLAANPTVGACLSSAFGPRGSGQHKGVDFHSDTGGPILAAADGVVIEAKYRDDYGNMLLIDHGNGVYARYAHLSSFADQVVEGARVTAGQQIGLMGNTASYSIPIHLHYEVLTGDYNNPRGSFGLTPNSPFSFPAANRG